MFINTNSSPIRSRMPLPPRKRNAPSSQRGGSTPVIEFDAAEGSPSTGAPPRSGYATPEPASSSSARLRHAPGTSRSGDASGLSRQSEQALSRQIDELGAMLREMREEMRVLREERSLSSAGRS
ncbi:hypothetical protein DL93DRAFT_2073920 [Clavulina sp. PMI_390]|nr:hypothetical protein DL93DRAFT_2073920 [Clavulina sp. PMI_390]